MGTNKTQANDGSVNEYVDAIIDTKRRAEVASLIQLMSETTKQAPVMWGPSIVGFGSYHYTYASGREGDAPRVALSSRKQAITVYGLVFYDTTHANNALLQKLGPHKTGKGCLYIKSLKDIDLAVLKQMIANSYINKA